MAKFTLRYIFILYTFINILTAMQQTYPDQVGVNISGINARGVSTYVDAAKVTNRYYYINQSGQAIISAGDRDEFGWPTIDFRMVLMDNRPTGEWFNDIDDPDVYRIDMSGLYKCSFSGSATFGSYVGGGWQIENMLYDSIANKSTFDLIVSAPGSNHGVVSWTVTNTKRSPTDSLGSGITNLKVIRPGYHDRPNQLFTDQFISTLTHADFTTVRAMNLMGLQWLSDFVYPDTMSWATRKKATDATYGNIPGKFGNAPWEHFIRLCNMVQMDMWINIPISASDNYIENLAQLIHDSLDVNLNVNIEIDNEVWVQNGHKDYNVAQAAALGIQPPENYARLAYRAGTIFNDVFGGNALNDRLHLMLMANSQMETSLEYMNSQYGPPENYLYGIGVAHYSHGYLGDIDRILDDYILSTVQKSKDRIYWINLADSWNLPGGYCSYEGGPGLNWVYIGDNSNSINFIPAHRDPSMAAVLRFNLLDHFLEIGGKMPIHFQLTTAYSRYGCWGLTDDVSYPDRNSKFQAIKEVMGDVTTPQPPQQFEASFIDENKVTLIWTDISDNEDGFRIERRENGGDFSELTTVGANITEYSDLTILPTSNYSYRINAFNGDGNSTSSLRLHITPYSIDNGIIVKPKYVYDASPFSASTVNAMNGVGIIGDEVIETGEPFSANFPVHTKISSQGWLAYAGGKNAVVIYDLGQTFNLTGLHLWNNNADAKQGTKEAAICGSPTLDGLDTASVEELLFVQAPNSSTYQGENYFFDKPVTGRYIRLNIHNSWGGVQGPGYSEIRFLANVEESLISPSSPDNVKSTSVTAISANLSWNPSVGGQAIKEYQVFSDQNLLAKTMDSKIILSGLAPDSTYNIYIRALDFGDNISTSSDTISINTKPIPQTVFQQDDDAQGIVSVEGESYEEKITLNAKDMQWKVYRSLAGASGRKSMQSFSPGNFDIKENYAAISPRLDYFVDFAHSGIHYVWVRGHARGDTLSDSFHAGLNGEAVAEAANITVNGTDEWKWSDTTITKQLAKIDIPEPGIHVLNIWVKETGFCFDKIVLTRDSLYVPQDLGPDESTSITTAIDDFADKNKQIPNEFSLMQNYPNPFNPSTIISYSLPKTEKVKLNVFNISGELVQSIVNAQQNSGYYSYKFNAENLASGIYFYRLNAGSFFAVKKMLLVR